MLIFSLQTKILFYYASERKAQLNVSRSKRLLIKLLQNFPESFSFE